GFLATVIGEINSTNLTPASGCQDHTTSPSASQRPRLRHRPRPPHPAPTSVTIAKRPSVWDGMACSTPVSTKPSSKISEIPKLFKCSRHSPRKASSPHERSDMRGSEKGTRMSLRSSGLRALFPLAAANLTPRVDPTLAGHPRHLLSFPAEARRSG